MRKPAGPIYIAFEIDWLRRFTLIIAAPRGYESYARKDANNVLRATFDRCATITATDPQRIRKIPANAERVKYCEWAWIVW